MKQFKKITISVIFAFLLLLASQVYAASDFELERLDFEATLNSDGSMDVIETWQVHIDGETNTLFKTFEIDFSKYSEITNVKVFEIDNDDKKEFAQSYTWKNHVDTDCFHALEYDGEFEIAWGVNKSSGNYVYSIEYTVKDIVNVYSDCAELYWQFIGEDFEEHIDEVTGTIYLPNKVELLDNLRVWGHGELNGEILREDEQTVKFNMSPFYSGTFLEIRVAILEPEMFAGAIKISNNDMLQNIIDEETAWAEEANARRERARRNVMILFWVATIGSCVIGVTFIPFIIKNFKKIKETQKIEPTQKLDYFREIPNEESSPSEVGFLYYYGKSSLSMVMPKVLSSTMLDLSLKKYIEFEVNDKLPKNEQVTVIIKEGNKELKESERIIYDLFKTIAKEDGKFNMKEFEKYAKKNNTTFLNKLNKIEKVVQKEQEEAKNYDKKMKEKHDNWIGIGVTVLTILTFVAFFVSISISFIPVIILTIPAVIYAMTCFTIAGKFNGLTQKGIDEQEKWEGLKKYMEDFSMLKDREVPELVLWEKYLVYATLFGNAEKVLKQLKVVYPEFSNDDYMRNTTYFYLIAHTDFNKSFVNSVNTSMQNAYMSSVSSSGGGYGGGFSGGGGGRRWRRPEAADAKIKKKREKRS